MDLKARVVYSLQRRSRAVMEPLYTDQAALRAETLGRLDEALKKTAALEERLRDLTTSLLFSRWMECPNALASRKELGYWLNWLGLLGEGAEIGVFRGEFSSHILETWAGARLVSIDPWREFPSAEYVDISNVSQDDQERNLREAEQRLLRFGDRSRTLRETSAGAASQFADGSLDFVYLDAQHHYEAVRNDIGLWFNKVKPGGILGGHDYLDGTLPSGIYGVKRAVDQFASANGYELVIARDPNWPSWFVKVA